MQLPPHTLLTPETFAAEIRRRIESGILADGSRLPTTMAWAKALGVDHRILQAGLASLASQGLLERKQRVGTIVKTSPRKPCLLILIGWPRLSGRATYFSALCAEIKSQAAIRGYRTEVFDNAFELLSADPALRAEAISTLRETIERLNPAGYIEVEFNLNRISELYPRYKKPTVVYGSSGARYRVQWDHNQLFIAPLEYFHRKHRRKILFLRHQRRINPVIDLELFWNEVRSHRFLRAEIREIFSHENPAEDYEAQMEAAGYRLMKEIIADWRTRRRNYIPDCLLVNDDVMMKGVGLALVEERFHPPDGLLIVVLSNSAIERHYPVPVTRFLLRVEEAAQCLVEMLTARIARHDRIEAPKLLHGEVMAHDNAGST